mmetsp:Transcript_2981/g.10680  ORF Transcript_2981/g.10680 Transcript_2981/m.10680 type:complete len:270 (+) Transcript_2981:1700-2509(+)
MCFCTLGSISGRPPLASRCAARSCASCASRFSSSASASISSSRSWSLTWKRILSMPPMRAASLTALSLTPASRSSDSRMSMRSASSSVTASFLAASRFACALPKLVAKMLAALSDSLRERRRVDLRSFSSASILLTLWMMRFATARRSRSMASVSSLNVHGVRSASPSAIACFSSSLVSSCPRGSPVFADHTRTAMSGDDVSTVGGSDTYRSVRTAPECATNSSTTDTSIGKSRRKRRCWRRWPPTRLWLMRADEPSREPARSRRRFGS